MTKQDNNPGRKCDRILREFDQDHELMAEGGWRCVNLTTIIAIICALMVKKSPRDDLDDLLVEIERDN